MSARIDIEHEGTRVDCTLYHNGTVIAVESVFYPNWLERVLGSTFESKLIRTLSRLRHKKEQLNFEDQEMRRVSNKYATDAGANE